MHHHKINLFTAFLLFLFAANLHGGQLNAIKSVKRDGQPVGLSFVFDKKVVIPNTFEANDNHMAVFDFPADMKIDVKKSDLAKLKGPVIKDVMLATSKKHQRLMFVLTRPDTMVLAKQSEHSIEYLFKSAFPEQKQSQDEQEDHIEGVINDITYNSNDSGNGVFSVKLPKNDTKVEVVAENDQQIVVKFHNLHIAKDWAHIMNVTSFGTPAKYITGKNAFAYSTFTIDTDVPAKFKENQMGNVYTIDVEARNESDTQFHKNKKISLNLQDINVRSALQILANFADINLVISDDVSGKVTLRLNDIPWQEALDIILVSENLGKRQIGDILYIASSSEITAHQQAEQAAKAAVEASEPLVVVYKQLNYAKAANMIEVLKSAGASFIGPRGSITSDKRTNTLIIKNTQEGADKILEVINRLDKPTKEVLVHARIVEINRTALEEVGVRFWAGQGGVPFSSSDVVGSIVGNEAGSASGTLFQQGAGLAKNAGQSALMLNFTRIFEAVDINMELSALETLNKAKSVSNPRLVVADNLTAFIRQGQEVPYLQSTASGAASIAFKEAVLELLVTPQISPNDTITLKVTVKKDRAEENTLVDGGPPPIATREIETQLIVDDGETVVLGGIYEKNIDKTNRQVPLLGDIPLLGWLFSYRRDSLENRELLIFLTTTILQK